MYVSFPSLIKVVSKQKNTMYIPLLSIWCDTHSQPFKSKGMNGITGGRSFPIVQLQTLNYVQLLYEWIYKQVRYLANYNNIFVDVTLICQAALTAS